MKKALVVYHPLSGAQKRKDSRDIIRKMLDQHEYSYEWFETVPADRQPFEQFLGRRFDRIIVAGGDGTISELASFLIVNGIKTPLVILPQGSANILAVSFFIPLNLCAALRVGLSGQPKVFDALRIHQRQYGLIAAGAGYDALVMRETPRDLKRKIGFFAYLWVIFKTIFVYRSRKYHIAIDGEKREVEAKTIMVFNVLPLGHLRMAKFFLRQPVFPNDGLLNIFVLNPRPFRDFFRLNRHVQVFHGKHIVIHSEENTHFQVDGEAFSGKILEVEVLPRAIRIIT